MRSFAPTRLGSLGISGSHSRGRKEATKRRRARAARSLLFEPLEVRHLLAAAIHDLHLLNDTGSSPSDLVTRDPQVAGTVQGDFSEGYVEVQFDHFGDGYVDGYTYAYSPGEPFTYDPRWYDYSLTEYAGTFTLNYRIVEFDWSYNAVMGDWQSFTFTLQPPLEAEISVVCEDWYGYEYGSELYDGYSSLYFDSTQVGTPVTRTLTIHNTGTGTLTLDPDSLTLPAGFSLVTPLASSVAPGGSAALTVQLDAAGGGQFQGPMSFSSNDADESPIDVWLYGDVYAAQPEIEVQDTYAYTTLYNGISTVDLGSTPLGSPVSRSFTIYNYGNGALTLDPASLTLPPGFSLVGSFPTAVAAFSSASFTIQLNAAAGGNYSGSVSFASDDADESPFSWMMSGTVIGTAAVVSVQSAQDAVEGGHAGYVRLARTGDASQELTVYYAIDLMASQATPGTDFLYLRGTSAANPGRGSVTFDPGASYADISIVALSDGLAEGGESLGIVLTGSTGYQLGATSSVALVLADPPVTSIDYSAGEVQTIVLPDTPGELSLLHDTGISASDRITTEPCLMGVARMSGGPWREVQVEFDADKDGLPDSSLPISNPSEAWFAYTATGLPLGEITISTRVAAVSDSGAASEPAQVGPWTPFDFTLATVHGANLAPNVGNLHLVRDTGRSTSDRVTSDPALTGTLSSSPPVTFYAMEFDLNGDGTRDAEALADSQGKYVYVPSGLAEGPVTISARARGWDYDEQAGVRAPWAPFTFTLESPHLEAPTVFALELGSDSGPSLGDAQTANNLLVGQVRGERTSAGITVYFDHDGDDVPDGVAFSDERGRFVYQPTALPLGNVTVRARASQWDFDQGHYVDGPWAQIAFEHQVQPNLAPKLVAAAVNDGDCLPWDAYEFAPLGGSSPSGGTAYDDDSSSAALGDGGSNAAANGPACVLSAPWVTTPHLVGRIVDDGPLWDAVIEVDYTGDLIADVETVTDDLGEFSLKLLGLDFGEMTISLRTRQLDHAAGQFIFGEWQALSFQFPAPPAETSPAPAVSLPTVRIADLHVATVGSLRASGAVAAADTVDGQIGVDVPASAGVSAPFDAGSWLLAQAAGIFVQVDVGGEGSADAEVPVDASGNFSYVLPAGPDGLATVRVRVRAPTRIPENSWEPLPEFLTTEPWATIRFVRAADPADPEMGQLSAALDAADADWRTWRLETDNPELTADGVYEWEQKAAREEYDEQVRQAAAARKTATAEATRVYQGNVRIADEAYHAAVAVANSQLESDLAAFSGDSVSHPWRDSVWPTPPPTDGLRIPDDEDQPHPPRAPTYDGPQYNFEADKMYQEAIESADRSHQTAKQAIEEAYRDAERQTQDAYRDAERAAQQRHTQALDAARSRYADELQVPHPTIDLTAEQDILNGHIAAANEAYAEAVSQAQRNYDDAVQAAAEARDESLRIAAEEYADRLAEAAAATTEAERLAILADAERTRLIAEANANYTYDVELARQQRRLAEAQAQAAVDRDYYWTAGGPVTPGLSWEDHFLAWWYNERDRKVAEHDHWINAYRAHADWTRAKDEAAADRTLAEDLAKAAQDQRDAVAQAAHDRDSALAQAETELWQAKADAALQALDRWNAYGQTPWTAYQKALAQHQVDYVRDLNAKYLTFRQDAIAATRTEAVAVSAAIRAKEDGQAQARCDEAVGRADALRALRLGANDAEHARAIAVAGILKMHRAESAAIEATLVRAQAVLDETLAVALATARRDLQLALADVVAGHILAGSPDPDPGSAAAAAQAQYDYDVAVTNAQRDYRDAGIEARRQASEDRNTGRTQAQRDALDEELTYRNTLADLFVVYGSAVAAAHAASSVAIVTEAGALNVAAAAAETVWWSTVAGAQRTYDDERAGLIRTADLADAAAWRLFHLQSAAGHVVSVAQWAADAFPTTASIACLPSLQLHGGELTLDASVTCGPLPTVTATSPWSQYQYDLAVAGLDYISDWTAGAVQEAGQLAAAGVSYVNSTSTTVESYDNDVAGAHETYVQDLVDGLTSHAQAVADADLDRDVQAATATGGHDRAVASANRDFHERVQTESLYLLYSRDYLDAERDREISAAAEELYLALAAARRTLALAQIAAGNDAEAARAAREQYDETVRLAGEHYQERVSTAWEHALSERDLREDSLEHTKADAARDVIHARTSQDATLTEKLAGYDSQLADAMRTAADDLADARGSAAADYSTASADAAQDRLDGYADADRTYAIADTAAAVDYYEATDAAGSDHREQTADDRGEYEVAMFGRHAGQMNAALSGVLALPTPSPVQELLLTYRSGAAVHDLGLSGAVRAARNDYHALLTPAYAAATTADGSADLTFTTSAAGADRNYRVSMSGAGRQWWVDFDAAVIQRQVDAQKADAARAREQAAAETAYSTQHAWAQARLQQSYADAYVQWIDDRIVADEVLEQPEVGPADGQYAYYLSTIADQARETEVRLAHEAYVAAMAGAQTDRADDLGAAEDAFAAALNAAGSAYASAVNGAESGFSSAAGSAWIGHVQGLVTADAQYANDLADSSRNLTSQLGNADVSLTHLLGAADVVHRDATAQRVAAYQVGRAQRRESVLASWSHPDAGFEQARAAAERVFLAGTQTQYATFAHDQAQADAGRDTAWAQAWADHQVRLADADILHTAQVGPLDVDHTVGVAVSENDVFQDLTTLVNARRTQLLAPYQSAAAASAADGHRYAVDLAAAEGAYQTAVAAARRAYQQAAAPIENQYAYDLYEAESDYQVDLAQQYPDAWTRYQAALLAAAERRAAALQSLIDARQAAVAQAERNRTAALADADRDRTGRLAGRELAYTQGYGAANRDYLRGLAGDLRDLDYDLAALDESYQNAVAAWDAQLEEDYALSDTLQWSDEQDAENVWSQAAGVAQADLWRAEYASQTGAATELDNQLNSPWSSVQRDLAAAKQTWWDANEPAYLAWIGQTSATDTAYQHHVNAAYLGRTGGWTGADVDYTHDVAAAARQWVEDRADEQYDYLMDQASRSYTYVDQYAQARHDARLAWAAADRWSRIGQDDSGAAYDSERHGQDVQAAQDAFTAATNTSRREYRRHRATGESHREIRLAEIDLQYVEDVAGAYVDWTAEVELHRRAFTESEATEASGRTYSIAAADDSYWRQEAGTFAAALAASYPPSSSGPIGAPWGPYAAAQETAESAWVTTTSTSRRVWEDSVADARKTERFDVAAALETRNNRLAQAWADREITKAQGRLQTARTGAYDDVIATLAGTRQQPLPRLPDCSPSTSGEPSAAFYQDTACLPAFSPLNLHAVLPDDYQIPTWALPPTSWGTDYPYGPTALTWVPPAQLADSQAHPVTPPLPASYSFISAPAPSPLDLSASLSSTDFPQYYNNVIDLIFGKWDFDATRHLSGFRTVGTALDAIFAAYASPPSEATEHLIPASANSDGTSGTTSGNPTPDDGSANSDGFASSTLSGTSGAHGDSGSLAGDGYSPSDAGGASVGANPGEPSSQDDAGTRCRSVRSGARPQTVDWTDNAVFRALSGALRTAFAEPSVGFVSEKFVVQGVLVMLVDVLPEANFAPHRIAYEGREWVVTIQATGTSAGDIAAAMEEASRLAKLQGLTFPAPRTAAWRALEATWHHRSFDRRSGTFIMELVNFDAHYDIAHRGGFAQYLDWLADAIRNHQIDQLSDDMAAAVLKTLRRENLAARIEGRLADEAFEIIAKRLRGKYGLIIKESGDIIGQIAGKKEGGKIIAWVVRPVAKVGQHAGPAIVVVTVFYAARSAYASDGDLSSAMKAAGRELVMADLGELIFTLTIVRGSEVVGYALVDPQGNVVRRYANSPEDQQAMLKYLQEAYDPEKLYQWHKEYVNKTRGYRLEDWTRPIDEWFRSWLPWSW